MRDIASVPLMATNCPECHHHHTTERHAHICIGCPCEWRPSPNVAAGDGVARGELRPVGVEVGPPATDGRTEVTFQLQSTLLGTTHDMQQLEDLLPEPGAFRREVLGEFVPIAPGPFDRVHQDFLRHASNTVTSALGIPDACKHLTRYACTGCSKVCCMTCDTPMEDQKLARELEVKTLGGRWCEECRNSGRQEMDLGRRPCDGEHPLPACASPQCWQSMRGPRIRQFAYDSPDVELPGATAARFERMPPEILHEATEELCECRGTICMKHAAIAELAIRRPPVVCIVGAAHAPEFIENKIAAEALAGRITLCPVELLDNEHTEEGARRAQFGDELLRRQVELADELLVLNLDGQVDRFAAIAVQHAEENGKAIRWLESPA